MRKRTNDLACGRSKSFFVVVGAGQAQAGPHRNLNLEARWNLLTARAPVLSEAAHPLPPDAEALSHLGPKRVPPRWGFRFCGAIAAWDFSQNKEPQAEYRLGTP